MLFQEEQLQQYKKDLFLKEQLTKQTVKTLFWKEQLKHSRRLLAEKNAIQTERASPRGEDLRCRTWKKRGLYRPVSLICGSKCTNQKRAPKAPFFCPFWPYCVSFLQRNWARVYKVAPLEEKNINMLPSMSTSWLYTLLVNMCKQQQVIDSKHQKNNSRIEICKDLYGKRFLL